MTLRAFETSFLKSSFSEILFERLQTFQIQLHGRWLKANFNFVLSIIARFWYCCKNLVSSYPSLIDLYQHETVDKNVAQIFIRFQNDFHLHKSFFEFKMSVIYGKSLHDLNGICLNGSSLHFHPHSKVNRRFCKVFFWEVWNTETP